MIVVVGWGVVVVVEVGIDVVVDVDVVCDVVVVITMVLCCVSGVLVSCVCYQYGCCLFLFCFGVC